MIDNYYHQRNNTSIGLEWFYELALLFLDVISEVKDSVVIL